MMRKLLLALIVLVVAAGGPAAFGAGGVSVDPGDRHFGSVAVNDSSDLSETITNNSGGDVDISLNTSGNSAFSIANDNCTGTLGDTLTCTFDVHYSPGSQGSDNGTLTVDEGTAGTDTFSLTGTATDPIDVQPGSLAFGDQHVGGNSPQQPVTVTNNSGHSVDLNISNSNPNDYSISGCGGGPLAGGDTCTIQVVFSPNAVGPQSGTLTVAGHDVSLTGRGTTNTIGVAPGSMGFGNQPVSTSSAPRTVTVTNTGSETLHSGPRPWAATTRFSSRSATTARPPRRSCRAISARSPSRSRRRCPEP